VKAFAKKHGLDDHRKPVPDFWISTLPLTLAADAEAMIEEVRAALGPRSPGLVVIDTLNQAIPGSDSDDEIMRAFGKAARRVADAFQCAVIAVHHSGWNDSRMRGSRSLQATEDAEIAVRKDEAGNTIAEVVAARDFAEGAITASRFEVLEVGAADNGDKISSLVMHEIEVPAGTKRTSERPKAGGKKLTEAEVYARLALEALQDLIIERGEIVFRQDIPEGARCVTVNDWKAHAENRGLVDDKTTKDASKKRWQRARSDLMGARQIGFSLPYVWLVKKDEDA
jgi:hypothetical protein